MRTHSPIARGPVESEANVRRIAMLCDMHGVPFGSPDKLAGFQLALTENKHLAMDFWALVGRLTEEESRETSIHTANAKILELIAVAVTGHGVAELISLGGEPRRMIGNLAGLIAGEDIRLPDVVGAGQDSPGIGAEVVGSGLGSSRGQPTAPALAQKKPFDPAAEVDPWVRPAADPRVDSKQSAFDAWFAERQARSRRTTAAPEASRATPEPQACESEVPVPVPAEEAAVATVAHEAVGQEPKTDEAILPEVEVPAFSETHAAEKRAQFEPEPGDLPVVAAGDGAEGAVAGVLGAEALGAVEVPEPAGSVASEQEKGSLREESRRLRLEPEQREGLEATAVRNERRQHFSFEDYPPEKSRLSRLAPWLVLLVVLLGGAGYFAQESGLLQDLDDAVRERVAGKMNGAGASPAEVLKAPLPATVPGAPKELASGASPETGDAIPTAGPVATAKPTAPVERRGSGAGTDSRAYRAPEDLRGAPEVQGSGAPATNVGGPLPVPEATMQASLISSRVPAYPEAAKAKHVQGRVVMQVVVTKSGSVGHLRVLEGDPTLRSAAVEAVSTWRYQPHLVNGVPTDVTTTVTVNFALQ